MKNYAKPGEVLYHVGLSVEMLQGAKYALVPGDPGRVEGLAKALDKKAVFLASHREFTSWLARVKGEPVLVMSSGMGGPNITRHYLYPGRHHRFPAGRDQSGGCGHLQGLRADGRG